MYLSIFEPLSINLVKNKRDRMNQRNEGEDE